MNTANKTIFPFTAIVGQEGLKLALLLNIIDPTIGGVLAIGDKGTGKTTLIRSLAALMSQQYDFPFVNLPIGASEDRVLGHINLEKLINDKKEVVQKGLLAKANQGVLYVDEINLLNDYLMDVLLDAASTGQYHLEREGISTAFDSKFCMVGSMNPEEGHLRPQLQDRFGLSVQIKTPTDLNIRTQIVQNRLSFDDNPQAFLEQYTTQETELRAQIAHAKQSLSDLVITPELVSYCSQLAAKNQVEGLRADILLIKTARAYAAYHSDEEVSVSHVDFIAPFVLGHRSNQPQQPSNQPEQPDNPQDNQQPHDQDEQEEQQERNADGDSGHHVFDSILPSHEINTVPAWKQDSKKGIDLNRSMEKKSPSPSPSDTKNGLDLRQTVGQYQATNKFELKHKKSQSKSGRHLIFLLDSSGSMAKDQVIAYSKGLIEKTIREYEYDHLTFSILTLYDGDAESIIEHTTDTDTLISSLQEIKTGGKTNIITAFKRIKELTSQKSNVVNELVMITDGKFNVGEEDEVAVFRTYCKAVQQTTIVDAELNTVKLGLAKTFASKINANYEPLTLSTSEVAS